MFSYITEKCKTDNGGCSDECDVEDGVGVVCSCPNGGQLMTDKKTCSKLIDLGADMMM